MAKFSTDPVVLADITQLEAVTDGMAVNFGTAITNLQNRQVLQDDKIDGLKTEQVAQDARITTLEGAP